MFDLFLLRAPIYALVFVLFAVFVGRRIILKKDFGYLKVSSTSIQTNLSFFWPFFVVLLIAFIFRLYPQEDLTSLNRGLNEGISSIRFVFFYSLISVPIQQILFFGELLEFLQNKFSKFYSVLIVSFLYSGIHMYYPKPFLILIFTFIFGLIWAYSAIKTKSIFGNIFFHISIGLVAFYLQLA